MKRHIVTLLFSALTTLLCAQTEGHYTFNVAKHNLSVENIESYFSKWFKIGEKTTFVKTVDTFDKIGMRHQKYQQYYGNTKVEHGVVLVHSKDDRVKSVTATVMERTNQVETDLNQPLRRSPKEGDELLIVPVATPVGTIYRPTRKRFDPEKGADIYTEAESGEVIKEVPRVFRLTGDAYTHYNGIRQIDFEKSGDMYTLVDSTRKIHTLNASRAAYTPGMSAADYANNSEEFLSVSDTWYGALTFVALQEIRGDWWKTSENDTIPELYFTLYASNGELLYTSDTLSPSNETAYPFLFGPISIQIDNGSYMEIYEKGDEVDAFGGRITITEADPEWILAWNDDYMSKGLSIKGDLLTYGEVYVMANPALDAHWGMQRTYDYYLETFGRESYDGLGSDIYQFIDPFGISGTHTDDNSFAKKTGLDLSDYFIGYGLGDYYYTYPCVTLDFVAHEFSHLVEYCSEFGGLEYIGESGALSESFADIMACAVEFYTLGDSANWDMGEGTLLDCHNIRSVSEPKKSCQYPTPDTYQGEYWHDVFDVSEEGDFGGVHKNSGVQNKWFYLLCEGGSGQNDNGDTYSVAPIGIDKAQQIVYRSFLYYLPPVAKYYDAMLCSVEATIDLYGEDSEELQSVLDAWYAVGVADADFKRNPSKCFASILSNNNSVGMTVGSGIYTKGEVVTITAIPIQEYINEGRESYFVEWSDGVSENPRTITISQDTLLLAVFGTRNMNDVQDIHRTRSVSVGDGTISVWLDEPKDVAILNMEGQCLFYDKKTARASVAVPGKGIYIVKIGEEEERVLVK